MSERLLRGPGQYDHDQRDERKSPKIHAASPTPLRPITVPNAAQRPRISYEGTYETDRQSDNVPATSVAASAC